MKNKNSPLKSISNFVDEILKDNARREAVKQSLFRSGDNQEFWVDEEIEFCPCDVKSSDSEGSPLWRNFMSSHHHILRSSSPNSHTPSFTPFSPNTEIREYCDRPNKFNRKFQELEASIMPEMLCSIDFYYEEFKTLSLFVSHLTENDEKQKISQLIKELKSKNSGDKAKHHENFQTALKKWKDQIAPSVTQATLKSYDSFHSMGQFHRQEPKYLKKLLELYVYQLLLEKAYISYMNLPNDPVTRKLFDQGFILYVLMCFKKHLATMEVIAALGTPIAVEYGNNYASFIEQKPFTIRQALSEQAGGQNAKRLALGRIRRFYLSLNAFLNQGNMSWIMLWWEPSFRVAISWLNFLFFLPRIAIALEDILTHTFLLGEHTKEEMALSMETRYTMILSRRWEMLVRDTGWMLNGLFALFVFVGVMGFWSLYLNTFIQLLEVFLNIFILSRFEEQQKLIMDYFTEQAEGLDVEQRELFFKDLESRTQLEYENRAVRLFNSIMILIGSVMILPTMASVSPIIPLIGAILALSISVFHFIYFPDWDERRRLKSEPFMISSDGVNMYKPTPEEEWYFIGLFPQNLDGRLSNLNLRTAF